MDIHCNKTHNESVLTDEQESSIKPVHKQANNWILIWEKDSKLTTLNKYWIDRVVSGCKGGFEQQSAPKTGKS